MSEAAAVALSDRWVRDRCLWVSLMLALLFCTYGMHWGVAESWNPDQMALRNLFDNDQPPFRPINFLKPPFHTYLSFIFVRAPLRGLSYLLGIDGSYRRIVELLLVRSLTVAMFLGQVVLVFVISRRFFGLNAARVASLLLASSAGFVSFGHFLTADIPVGFWMLLAFWSAQNILLRGRRQDYVLAGLCTGLAAATKYNGLAIGLSMVAAHWLAEDSPWRAGDWPAWQRRLFEPTLLLGLGMVAVGFVLGNPFAILDAREFVGDFMYNLSTTPVYGGVVENAGYRMFWEKFGEIFGWPGSILIGLGSVLALLRLVLGRADRLEVHGVLMLVSVSGLYYLYFGSFGRLETRFVLPVAPYFLMLIGPLCAAFRLRYVAPVLVAVVGYNVICSLYVGWRFTHDPRMAARAWIRDNVAEGSTVEYTAHAPRPDRFIERFEAVPMPEISGRTALFREILGDNPWVADRLDSFEPTGDAEWYTADRLAMRAPDYIWIDSLEYARFFSSMESKEYPGVRRYFADLLGERSNYAIVYDGVNPDVPWWVYPRQIDFLENRLTLLERQAQGSQPVDP